MVLQRSWVQILYGPEFFSSLILTTSSVVFIAARIAYISVDIFIEFASIFKKKEVGNHKLKKLCKIELLHSFILCVTFFLRIIVKVFLIWQTKYGMLFTSVFVWLFSVSLAVMHFLL